MATDFAERPDPTLIGYSENQEKNCKAISPSLLTLASLSVYGQPGRLKMINEIFDELSR